MCTLKANKVTNTDESRIPKNRKVKNLSIQPLRVVATCHHCKAPQFARQLTCKNCSAYLDNQPQMVGAPRHCSKVKLAAVAALTFVAMSAACMLHII